MSLVAYVDQSAFISVHLHTSLLESILPLFLPGSSAAADQLPAYATN